MGAYQWQAVQEIQVRIDSLYSRKDPEHRIRKTAEQLKEFIKNKKKGAKKDESLLNR